MPDSWIARARLLAALVVVLTGIHLLNVLSDGYLNRYGIVPRIPARVGNIFSAPFIHRDFAHLFNNLVSLVVLSGFVILRSVKFYLASSAFIISIGGALVWLCGRAAYHIGSSGWIFGLWGLSIALACFDRRLMNILILVVVIALYGAMATAIVPGDPSISYEAHLAGTAAGIMWAYLYAKATRAPRAA